MQSQTYLTKGHPHVLSGEGVSYVNITLTDNVNVLHISFEKDKYIV